MARVDGPLFSLTASGRFEELVYDKRGYVRRFVVPTNPKSAAQGNARQILLAAQKATSKLGTSAREDVKAYLGAIGLVGYRWNAWTLQAIIGEGSQAWADSKTAYTALGDDQQGWETKAQEIGLIQISIPYASDDPITPGLAMWALARALDGMGLGPGTPDGTNYGAWGDYITT